MLVGVLMIRGGILDEELSSREMLSLVMEESMVFSKKRYFESVTMYLLSWYTATKKQKSQPCLDCLDRVKSGRHN
jgi:hypothetical protein